MKRITNKKLQTALLRGAVLLSGCMATVTAMLFCETIGSLAAILTLGVVCTTLIDNYISENNK